jgi:replicative DNA helicase
MNATEDDATHDRTPPQDIQAEQSVLGGMMLSAGAIAEVLDVPLTAADFYRPAHETIFATILDLNGRGEPADVVTVAAELMRLGDIARVGGAPYLHTLINAVPTAANAGYYADIVKERAILRRLGEAGTRIVQMSYSTDGTDIAAIVDRAAADIQAVIGAQAGDEDMAPTSVDAESFLDDLLDGEEQNFLPLPYADLADCAPIEGGELVTVAGAPGMGKSVVLLDMARHAALKCGLPVLYVSIEMPRKQLLQRMYAAEARVPQDRLRSRRDSERLSDEDMVRVWKAKDRIASVNLNLWTTGSVTVPALRTRLRRMQAQKALPAVVFIDYLQIMKVDRESGNRTVDVSGLSGGLKRIAMDFNIPIIVGAQLNRNLEQRADKRPMLSDLRESGSIEQDSSVVVMLYRDDYYDRESPLAGEMDLLVRKNRMGTTANITVAFQGHYARAVDMARSDDLEPSR